MTHTITSSRANAVPRLGTLTPDRQSLDGTCNTWQPLFAGTARSAQGHIEHSHTENTRLFSQFETIASPSL